ncbi:MAG: SDR family oxidoreductase [Acidobacteria bacterium]|nr:SDR family oxidoreductase [Acidobacteriota bacterium]MCI0723791.1 SDR family oxidoreductase [Acidobacteriota bacterium]
MATFITGSTGYLGAHVATGLLERYGQKLNLLVRANDRRAAELKLWRALQLHLDFARFDEWLNTHIEIFLGDITQQRFGLDTTEYTRLVKTTDSVLHIAASLNRKSEKTCLNVNLRGTLEVLKFANRVLANEGLRRYSHVSTVAVAGIRSNEVVTEAASIDWERSDYDPYARTKKFCEHMARELLPNVPLTIFRPSIVLGDSRHGETTQFDMVKAFVFLARLPALPLRPTDRLDIVNVDFVADSIVTLHQKEKPLHDTYHLSAGTHAPTCRDITETLSKARGQSGPLYLPGLAKPFEGIVSWLSNRRGTSVGQLAALLKVFLPYLLWNTVFDNQRVVQETGKTPVNFTHYGFSLFEFSRKHNFTYPYREWPEAAGRSAQ